MCMIEFPDPRKILAAGVVLGLLLALLLWGAWELASALIDISIAFN